MAYDTEMRTHGTTCVTLKGTKTKEIRGTELLKGTDLMKLQLMPPCHAGHNQLQDPIGTRDV